MPKKKKRKFGRLHPLFVPQGIERIVTLCGQIFGKVGKIERSLAAQAEGPYRYFVSFYYYNPPDLIGFSNMSVNLDNPIDYAAILDFQESFDPEIYGKVVVINFILLDE